MRVEDNVSTSNDSRSSAVSRSNEARGDSRTERRTENPTDTASLSSLAVQLSRGLERESAQESARIEQLQKAVANGTYDAPSAAVSRRIVDAAVGADL